MNADFRDSNELVSVNLLDRMAVPDLCGKNYFIPDYQRGYRWGELQINQLLEDLCRFFYADDAQGEFYCLQPVVVKQLCTTDVEKYGLYSDLDNNRWFEVVDGQQRLTTLLIILSLIALLDEDFNLSFRIHYMTRPLLGNMFANMTVQKDDANRYQVCFDGFTNPDIDTWHILQAANHVLNWFHTEHRNFNTDITIGTFKKSFSEYLSQSKSGKKSVQVIWYELRDGSDANEMFKRLNDKKVSLNNAELIRAMFLSDSAQYPCDAQWLKQFGSEAAQVVRQRELARKQSHIIEQWDLMERQLRNDRFWAFVFQDIRQNPYSCRIEYLFDLISQKKQDEKDPLFTYLEFEKLLTDPMAGDLWHLWLKVESYFSTLLAWYEDSYYFHTVGFLTTVYGADILAQLLEDAAQKSKDLFKNDLFGKIYDAVHDRKHPCRILNYTYEEHGKLLQNTLFLYNVLSTYLQNKEFFDFNQYKREDWTLEHIHAQNSERIDRSQKDKWSEWFDENGKALFRLYERFHDDKDFASVYKDFNDEKSRFETHRDKYSFEDLTRIFDRVLNYFNTLSKQDGIPTMMHDISNMALLSSDVNSSISNSVFEVKRQCIKELDAQGKYIPLCTRKVFLKYYNRTNPNFTVQQEFYWSETDRRNYLADIQRVLQNFINIENEAAYE